MGKTSPMAPKAKQIVPATISKPRTNRFFLSFEEGMFGWFVILFHVFNSCQK
jgi:hypothetical protein